MIELPKRHNKGEIKIWSSISDAAHKIDGMNMGRGRECRSSPSPWKGHIKYLILEK